MAAERAIAFALLVLFVGGNVWVESLNQGVTQANGRVLDWWSNELSDYLANVKQAWVQDVTYIGLAIGELVMIHACKGGRVWSIALLCACVGLVSVVVTAVLKARPGAPAWMEKAHVVSALVAFLSAIVAETAYLLHTPAVWLPVGGAVATVAFHYLAPTKGALAEKCLCAFVVAGLLVIVAPAL